MQAIMRKYEQKQLRNHDILTQHYEVVYRQLPEFKSLDDSISILSVQYGKRLLNGDQKAISSLKEELAILRASKQELLRSSGFPADYLEPVYDCPNCKDTGYIGNQKCHCFKKAIIDLLYEQSNLNWNRSMIVRIVKIPDISETKNVTVSKKPSLTYFMNSQT